MALAVASTQVQAAMAQREAWFNQGLTPAQIAQANIVVDHSAAQNTCPACLHVFETGPRHCPDCGLFLG